MRREGRQHGFVRTNMVLPSPWNLKPDSTRFINKFDSPATAGFFTRVHQKPTNHSKFTGKCGKPRCSGCHMHPWCKSKDKTKGCQKLRSHDVLSNCRLITWRLVEGRPGLNFSGFSATGILDHLATNYDHHTDDEVDDDNVDCEDDFEEGYGSSSSHGRGITAGTEIEEIVAAAADDDDHKDHDLEDDDDDMGFCDVGFVLDQVEDEDEGWCLVAEK
ncbi:hypothetical protein Tsubulata_045755 [Turnera subulata]|uniref:Uncharacterized protein n=1 Tax=Turnera subulata TaxID=218843 RepID=A0A9Q0EYX3_9ROSI|nr:hypothetical protein Tsubulata_045755 [Turnera subulata]